MNYRSVINDFKSKKVLVIGDLILDKYISGTSGRISPEAPVPVISHNGTEYQLGGASNVAKNIINLGAETHLIGTAGKDNNGRTITKLLGKAGINPENIIKDSNKPTTLKTRIISGNQQLLRIDEERTSEISSDIQDQLLEMIQKVIRTSNPDAVIISDYNKGTVTDKICRVAIKMAERSGAFIAVDPKGKDFRKYRGANVITPNRNESETVYGKPISDNNVLVKALKKIKSDTGAEGVVITKGSEGVSFIKGNKVFNVPTAEKDVYDVTGAGDTFISAFTLSVLCSGSWTTAAKIANAASSVVIDHLGTGSLTRDQLVNRLSFPEKIQNIRDLIPVLNERRKKGEKVVFTNGCFDILHTGHIKLLRKSRKYGDLLVVALNSDRSVRKLKGENRPFFSENDRAAIVSEFTCVDYVIIFDEDTPLSTIKKLRPDVITKGADYKKEQIVGKDLVESCGGQVRIVPLEQGRSTSYFADKIRKD